MCRAPRILPSLLLLSLTGCAGPESKPAAAARKAPPERASPADEARWFSKQNQLSMQLVEDQVLGKRFLPGGNLARYRRGAKEYDLFLVRARDAQAAALLAFEYKAVLQGAKLIPHFGGYFGRDTDGRDAFVFSKSAWLIGIVGLPETEADVVAREFAARLQSR